MTSRSILVPVLAISALWTLDTISAEALSASALVTQGDVLMQEARNTLSHDFQAAEEAYSQALALEPKNLGALLGMAWVENSNHDFTAGKEWAQAALAENPNALDAHALIGDGAVELGNYDEALEHYQKALDIRADLSTFSRAAHLLWLNGDDSQAQEFMKRAIASGGPHLENSAWCRAELAIMYLKTGSTIKARQEAEAAVKLAPKNPRTLMALGRTLAAENKFEEAISAFEDSINITPTHDALAPLAELYQITGQTQKAEAQIEKVVRYHLPNVHQHGHEHHSHGHSHSHAHGHSHQASHQLALFLADQDRSLSLALEQAEAAYQEFPNLHAADALAWSLFKKGELQKAHHYSQQALKFGTSEPIFHYHAGLIAEALENESEARKHLSHALDLNPTFALKHAKTAREVLSKVTPKS